MNETTFFEALVWGAYLVGLVAIGHMLRDLVVAVLGAWPASKGKEGD